jgi:hypothetical protein
MVTQIQITLAFSGATSDNALIDFYDVSQALLGFQRSLALTTHLVVNGEIITQAPSPKGARIYVRPPEAGSWKVSACVLMGLTGAYHLGTAPKDSPIGHIVYSLYDYVVSETLGGNVDYNKTLGKLYEEAQKNKLPVKPVTESQAESLIEKCSAAIREIHRPISVTGTAKSATISVEFGTQSVPLSTTLSIFTFDFMNETRQSQDVEQIVGRITSYNSNTYKGRIYVGGIGRPVNFEINPRGRSAAAVQAVTTSLHLNATRLGNQDGALVAMSVFRRESKAGHLKGFLAVLVAKRGGA